jgi:hypothetical protein
MAKTKYTYSVSGDFPNGKVATDRLTEEIQESTIITALDYITVYGDDCDIWFKDALSAGDQTTLDGIVAAHSGEPLEPDAVPVQLPQARFDTDQKQVTVITPAPRGTFTWYTSCGDVKDPLGRGEGEQALIEIAGGTTPGGSASPHVVKLSFAEDGGVYIHDGEINWRNMVQGNTVGFGGADLFSVYIEFPETPAEAITSTPGTGNCNLAPYGPGNVIVPAGGDGQYTVDLTKAVPLPDSSGLWMVNQKTGEIVQNVGQDKGEFGMICTLLDFQAPGSKFFLIRRIGMTRIQGMMEINAYLVEWASKWWNLCLSVEKNVAHTDDVEIGAWMMLFRRNATINGN